MTGARRGTQQLTTFRAFRGTSEGYCSEEEEKTLVHHLELLGSKTEHAHGPQIIAPDNRPGRAFSKGAENQLSMSLSCQDVACALLVTVLF